MVRKIVDYKTLMHDSLLELEDYVKSYLDAGWELVGEPILGSCEAGVPVWSYAQTMIKYEEDTVGGV